jgi:negative regulator of replication initiation
VSPRQFNRRNAVQGLMLACSLLYRLDEEAVADTQAA